MILLEIKLISYFPKLKDLPINRASVAIQV